MNRLKLDFTLESAQERVDFINTYIKQFDRLTEKEIVTIEEYLLWGKTDEGIALGAGTGLETKWSKPKEAESLDAVLENPALANSQLYSLNDAILYKKNRDVFNRSEARKQAPPFLVRLFEDLWRNIDETELEINFYEERVGKRDKPPREELLKRFTNEEIESIRARSQKLNQYKYLKLRHRLKELRTEQFTIRDSYKTSFNITQSIYSPKDKTFVFDYDVEVLPLGIKEGEVGKLIFDINFDPRALTEKQLQIISDLIWRKKDFKGTKTFDFRNLEMVYQLYLFKDELYDRVKKLNMII